MTKHTLKILGCEHRKIFKVCLTILQHYAWKGWLRISVPVNSCTIYFTARKVFLRYFVFLLFNMRGSHYPVGKTWSWVYLSNWFDNFFIFLDISCNVIGPIFLPNLLYFCQNLWSTTVFCFELWSRLTWTSVIYPWELCK